MVIFVIYFLGISHSPFALFLHSQLSEAYDQVGCMLYSSVYYFFGGINKYDDS